MYQTKPEKPVSFSGNKLSSRVNISDKAKFERKHVIYLRTCPYLTFNHYYINDSKQRWQRN